MNRFNLAHNKQNLNLIGRCAFVGDKLFCEFTASGFELRADFDCTPVSISIDVLADGGHFGVMVDDDYENMLDFVTPRGKQTITIFEKLCGVHTLRVVKLFEFAHGRIEFESINFDGKILDKPSMKDLKFEFYGNSLTCGYGNLATTRNAPETFNFLEHGYKTWCIRLARHFGADANIVSSSGQGVVFDCTGNPNGTVFKYFDKDVMSLSLKHDFSSYVPDVIFFYLGTNDINYIRNSGKKMDWAHYKSETKRLIDSLRSHAPESKIVILAGHEKGANPLHEELVDAFNEIASEYKDIYVFDDIADDKRGSNWHPNVEDHDEMFKQILKHVEKII